MKIEGRDRKVTPKDAVWGVSVTNMWTSKNRFPPVPWDFQCPMQDHWWRWQKTKRDYGLNQNMYIKKIVLKKEHQYDIMYSFIVALDGLNGHRKQWELENLVTHSLHKKIFLLGIAISLQDLPTFFVCEKCARVL